MSEAVAYPMHNSPRCAAKSKRTGLPCCSPAVKGWAVCRMHGARGGAGAGSANPAYRHGMRSKEWTDLRALASDLAREGRELADRLKG